jgi:hypothetical protein
MSAAGGEVSRSLLYEPLDTSVDTIRLLVLEPGDPSSVVRCRLECTTFANKPVYQALSYEWGREPPSEKIQLNGRIFAVRENLFNALVHLRDTKIPKTLWIDALCINQSDLEERNSQVGLMAFIYRRATTVMVWLGQVPQQLIREETSWLCLREYWGRLWIVQEICLATRLSIIRKPTPALDTRDGLPAIMETHRLQEWADFIRSVRQSVTTATYANKVKYLLPLKLDEQRQHRHGDLNTLENLIKTFANARCHEPRDKIYGFLGLANDCHGDLKVDYSKSMFQIYKEVVWFQYRAAPLEPLQPAIDRPMRIVRFSQLLQRLFEGAIQDEIKVQLQQEQQNFLKKEPGPLQARAMLVGEIVHLGPILKDMIGSFDAVQKWYASLNRYYTRSSDIRRMREQDEVFSQEILQMQECDLDRVCPLPSLYSWGNKSRAKWSPFKWEVNLEDDLEDDFNGDLGDDLIDDITNRAGFDNGEFTSSRDINQPCMFLGSNFVIGLVPSCAKKGDVICRFWNCDVAIVMRRGDEEHSFKVIGRAKVGTNVFASDIEHDDFDQTLEHDGVMNIYLDIHTLQKLTF